jgi:hypothetical protein
MSAEKAATSKMGSLSMGGSPLSFSFLLRFYPLSRNNKRVATRLLPTKRECTSKPKHSTGIPKWGKSGHLPVLRDN